MQIIANRKIFYILSGILVSASLLSLLTLGLHFGIDFTGGSLLEVEYGGVRPDSEVIRRNLESFNLGSVIIQQTGSLGLILRFRDVDEKTHQEIMASLKKTAPVLSEKRFDAIGPTIGQELKRKSIYAIVVVLVLIVLYISWAFRKVSKPVSSWKYGVVAVVALFHDVLIPTGLFAVLGKFAGAEVDTLFVTALLTILGFSVHDTIVVFDRVRENLRNARGQGVDFSAIVEQSVKETIVRSINTSFTVILSLLAVFLLGGESVRYFTLTLIVGVIIGTYSSIFIASPLLVTWQLFSNRQK